VLVLVESVEKMMTIRVRAVELGVKCPDTKKSSGNCWEGGIERTVEAWFVFALLPRR